MVCSGRSPDDPIVFVNDLFAHLTGYTKDELVGLRVANLIAPAIEGAGANSWLPKDRHPEQEVVLLRKDGTSSRNALSIVPIAVDNGSAYVVATFTETTGPDGSAGTALRASEKQLAEVRERLRLTLSLTGAAAAWEWYIGKNKIVGDPRFAALYGITAEEAAAGVTPDVFFSIVHPDDLPRVRLAIGGILRGAEVLSKEYRILLSNHSVRWVQARGRCQYDSEDRPTRFSGVLLDITEQKHAEERLRIAQSSGGIGTFEHIEGFATATVSTQFCNLLGLQPARDLPVHTINSVVHPDDPPLIETGVRAAPGREMHSELRIIRPDTGAVRWLAKRGEYLRDADTAGLRFSGVIYDITNSKSIEENLRDLNETLETRVQERTRERDGIWQLSKDLLAIADENGVWLSVNPAWTRVLGWHANEIVGRTSHWLQHPDDPKQDRLLSSAGETSTQSFQNRLRTRGGDYRSLAWTAVPQAGLFYCVARDVTEQFSREVTLARAEEQLRQAHKMEAVGQLTGGIAHDFNNMLTGVISALGLIGRRLKAGRTDGLEEFIEAGINSANRAATLTHSLLAFARRQSLDVKSQDINSIISGIREILLRPLGESISLELVLDPQLWPALTDANQFESALLNLALNSRDAMPDGGQLTIRTVNTHLEGPIQVHDGEIGTGDYVVVSVSDTGSGMPPDVIAKAFEPFFTTKPIGQGTGLGLSMIYGFVKQAGGHVRIESEVARGTTVNMYLRRAPRRGRNCRRAEPTHHPRPWRDGTDRGGRCFGPLHDNGAAEGLGLQVFRGRGRRRRRYRSFNPVDASILLVTDVGLPNMNGRQLAEVGRQLRPGLKVLFISGYAEMAAVRGGFLGAGMQMLGKPFTVEVLSAKICELIEG